MAKNIGYIVCLFIMALNIVAGILGLEAEKAQNKETHLGLKILECRKTSHHAYGLGLAATILLSIAHAIANFLGGYVSIAYEETHRKSSNNRQLAIASLIFSWVVFAVAFSLLLVATLGNQNPGASCGISHHRFFEIGGIMCFIHGVFSAVYCAAVSA